MNRQGVEILLVLGGIFLFLLGTGLAWLLAPYMTREQFIMAELLVVFLLIGVGFAASLFYEAYATNLRWLAEAIRLVATVNPAHRVKPEGPPVVRQLVEAVNDLADRFQTMQENQSRQIQQAQAELENERNRLAALMSDLTAGVLVCNMEGQILLYNNQARQLLTGSTPTAGQGVGAWVGLGRSVFGLIDRHAINHMLEELAYRQQKDYQNPLAHFVTTAANGQLIRARMAPIWDQQQAMTGFVLTLEDITGRHLSSLRRDALLQSLTEGIRASLSNIRTAIETIQQYPDMTQDRLDRLHRVIADEALALSLKLDEATGKYAADLKATWELAEMMSSDLLWAIQRRFEDKLGLDTSLEGADENLWLKVDSYLLVQALQALARRLQEQFQLRQVILRLSRSGQMAALDLAWPDDGHIDTETMWLWQNAPLTTDDDMPVITLQEVAEHHGGEVWFQVDTAGQLAFFRILLPTTQPHQPRLIQPTQESRPEYYDFDLFDQSRPESELDRQSLADLTYTVFDTETTGLNPSAGDEIISISAVRIVNGRLLRQEIFDQMVNPKRPITPKARQVHSIPPEVLQNQPTIEQVLPVFHKFAEGTVLVAHNAAFDMRLLQLKEAKTGVKFTNPVLDTLLLAAIVHPHYSDYSLEALAHRLGIPLLGRHTSLGDAIMTGEIFLRLIPLLADHGIYTLADAREASEKSYYTRLKY